METLHRGAEAVLYRDVEIVVKDRIKKGYRQNALDERIRRQRTRLESNIMIKAKRFGVNVPHILETGEFKITMEFIDGKRLKDHLEELAPGIYSKIGEAVATLHGAGIMHGDLTTSNMVHRDRVFLIDFGLAKNTRKVEDLAVDLFLLYESLKAGHFLVLKDAWSGFLKAYKRKYSNAEIVLAQMEKIKTRRRYKT